MPTYTFKCLDCKQIFDMRNIPIAHRDLLLPPCEHCRGVNTKRIMHQNVAFFFKEDFSKQMSTKPDSYWENAERNRLLALDKRRKERLEKVVYKDKATVDSLRNMAVNEERHGKAGDDPVRIEKARQVRELIKEA